MPISLLEVEDSLARVRSGLESRARRIEGRVGQELAAHISRPGKMLRARFALLLAGALGAEESKAEGVARAMELVHNASLLHDDCVDEAELRRGHPTPNKVFGTTVGLLLGDLAFSQGLEEAIDISPNAPRLLVTAVREMKGMLGLIKDTHKVMFDAQRTVKMQDRVLDFFREKHPELAEEFATWLAEAGL